MTIFKYLLICITLLSAFPATAKEHAARFDIFWSGLHVGKLVASIEEDDNRYRMRTAMEANGMIRALTNFHGISMVEGSIQNGTYTPERFGFFFQLREKERTAEIAFDKTSNATITHKVPPEKKGKRPEVPAELLQQVIDPLTSILHIQTWLPKAKEKENLTLEMFDARRRSKLIVELDEIRGEHYRINVKREAIAGYTNNELERIQKKEEPIISFAVTKDTLYPEKAEAIASLGTAMGHLRGTCASFEACLDEHQIFYKQRFTEFTFPTDMKHGR